MKKVNLVVLATLMTLSLSNIVKAGTCQDIMIPLYVYPDIWKVDGVWDRAMNAPLADDQVRYLIVNPDSGPGAGPDTTQYNDYINAIDKIRSLNNPNLLVCGYVHTEYGSRQLTLVEKEISQYNDWYNVDCIFLDEASIHSADISYYQGIVNYYNTLSDGSNVILNHGFWPDKGYMNIISESNAESIHVVTENSYDAYTTDLSLATVPQWVLDWPEVSNWRLIHLIHSTSNTAKMQNALRLSESRNAGGVFIAFDVLDNPWDWSSGEPYWELLAAETSEGCN